MKHRKETAEIAARVVSLAAAGRSAALATAVHISGSAYRRPGAKFLIDDEGCTLGGVSGGCLEADVRRIAREVIRTGMARVLHYETGSDDRTIWGLGLGCNGSVDLFLQRATSAPAIDVLQSVHQLLQRNAGPFAIATVVDGADAGRAMIVDQRGIPHGSIQPHLDAFVTQIAGMAIPDGRSRIANHPALPHVFLDVIEPPAQLIVCGAGDDALPLVAYAADAGFAVTVVDHRAQLLTSERFPAASRLVSLRAGDDMAPLDAGPATFAVVKTHAFGDDREWVRGFVQAGAAYIGLLGPRARREEIAGQIGVTAEQVFGPAGLDIGADGPEQIAISIVGEMLACRAGRDARHLREKAETIHAV
jgi:xanthine/CO dehydrogenase XdhC/CoxF family maturation factor